MITNTQICCVCEEKVNLDTEDSWAVTEDNVVCSKDCWEVWKARGQDKRLDDPRR